MTKSHQDQIKPFFLTEDAAAELAAAGYEFKPPGHARTKSVRDLYGWQPNETLEEAIARHMGKTRSPS